MTELDNLLRAGLGDLSVYYCYYSNLFVFCNPSRLVHIWFNIKKTTTYNCLFVFVLFFCTSLCYFYPIGFTIGNLSAGENIKKVLKCFSSQLAVSVLTTDRDLKYTLIIFFFKLFQFYSKGN